MFVRSAGHTGARFARGGQARFRKGHPQKSGRSMAALGQEEAGKRELRHTPGAQGSAQDHIRLLRLLTITTTTLKLLAALSKLRHFLTTPLHSTPSVVLQPALAGGQISLRSTVCGMRREEKCPQLLIFTNDLPIH